MNFFANTNLREFGLINRYTGFYIGIRVIDGLELSFLLRFSLDISGLKTNGIPILFINGNSYI